MYLTIFGGKYSINSLHLLNISLLENMDIYVNIYVYVCAYIYVCTYMYTHIYEIRRPKLLGVMSKERLAGAY